MYTTCMFCKKPLGSNQVIEHFPVGAAVIAGFNTGGGYRFQVEHAVDQIESSGHPSRFIADTARLGIRWGRAGHIRKLPHHTRLALEMALHEERERRALEGELWVLEQAWKEAEEIAAISDNLLLPAGTDEFFRRHGRESATSQQRKGTIE